MFLRCTLRQWLLPLPKGTLLRSLFFGFVLLDLICVVSYHDHRVPHRKSRVNSIVRFLSQDSAVDISQFQYRTATCCVMFSEIRRCSSHAMKSFAPMYRSESCLCFHVPLFFSCVFF